MSSAQRSVLLALSSVSLAALFVWYIQSRRKSGPRQILGDDQTSINTRSEQERSAIKPTERSSHKIEEVGVSVDCGAEVIDENGFRYPQSSKNHFDDISNGCCFSFLPANFKRFTVGSQPNIVGSKDESLLAKTTEKKRSVEERCSEEKHAEPQAFSWSDEMEKCYTVEFKKKEEEQRQYENNVGNNGSADYATSDSPGLASQNSEWNGVSSLSVFFPVTHPPEPLCEFCPNSVLLAQSSLFLLFDEMYCNQLIVDVDVNAESSSRTRNQSNATVNECDNLYMDELRSCVHSALEFLDELQSRQPEMIRRTSIINRRETGVYLVANSEKTVRKELELCLYWFFFDMVFTLSLNLC
uniref:RMDN2 n=1 Tax=Angiostrongylus cantonensis TaxID=6313 RepID=A0A0K0DLF3_ANGCA